jgi:uncharacterized protein (DUF1330 family)
MTDIYIDPSPANFAAFKALPRDEPIHMLNLLRYRDRAEYPEGHEHAGKGWTGRRAYEEYGKTSGPIFRRVGGAIVWRGVFQTMVTGPDDRRWDDGFIAQYPGSGSFFEMIKDPEYQAAVVNRTAALADSRLVRFAPSDHGGGF